jgi:CDP-glucose 4,6-dehydratase
MSPSSLQIPAPRPALHSTPVLGGAAAVGRLPSRSFWHGRRVLLTGHTGFKGSWLAWWLHQLGAEVHGLALPPQSGSHYLQNGTAEAMTAATEGDIRDPSLVTSVVERTQPQIVFHLAAQALIRAGYADPVGTVATNVMGTLNLLQACRERGGLQALLIVTTDKCYRNDGGPWALRETDPLGGRDPYSASKACAELLTEGYAQSYFSGNSTAVRSARAGNVIGGGDVCTDRLIPDLFRSLDSRSPIHLRNPWAVRPWQHVLDALCGYLVLTQAMAQAPQSLANAYNFGPSEVQDWPVQSVVEQMLTHMGVSAEISSQQAKAHEHEAPSLKLDSSMARRDLGWTSRLSTPQAIQWTAEWERGVRVGTPARQITLNQIDRYMSPEESHGA